MRRPISHPLFPPAAEPQESSRTSVQLGRGISVEAWITHHAARPQERLPARAVVTLSLTGGGRAERGVVAERALARALEALSELEAEEAAGLAGVFTLLTRPAPPEPVEPVVRSEIPAPEMTRPEILMPEILATEILPPDPPEEPLDPYEQPFLLALLS